MHKYAKKLGSLLLAVFLLLGGALPAFAYEFPSDSFLYDAWGNPLTTPSPYLYTQTIRGSTLGIGEFSSPSDFCVDENNQVYLMDSKNGRIVILDRQYRLVKVIEAFTGGEEEIKLKDADGIFVRDGKIYLCLPKQSLVVVADMDGRLLQSITHGEEVQDDEPVAFEPLKVTVDNDGILYVIGKGVYKGAFTFSRTGEFLGFYGNNQVTVAGDLLTQLFWKRFYTQEQLQRLERMLPVEFDNFDIDADGFIYTVTSSEEDKQIKKFNPKGTNIFQYGKTTRFGAIDVVTDKSNTTKSMFCDISVSEAGILAALDKGYNRVFLYDPSANMLGNFGGSGSQSGGFVSPVAIEQLDGDILVLDAGKNSISVFSPSAYGTALMKAAVLTDDGQFDAATASWEEVLKLNANCELAYSGIGKSLLNQQDYAGAMKYYKAGNDKAGYSSAFKEYRNNKIQQFFPLICVVFVIAVAGVGVLSARAKKRHKALELERKYTVAKPWQVPFVLMRHPAAGYQDMKFEKNGSMLLAGLVVLLWFLTEIISFHSTGFIFNENSPNSFNIVFVLFRTVGMFLLWTIANWALCTLFNGEGKWSEIFVATAYALTPYVLSSVPLTIISNFLTQEEGAFLSYARVFFLLWSVLLLLIGTMTVHQYTVGKTLLALIFTVVGVLLIIFIFVLIYILFKQVFDFGASILNELLQMQ